MVDSQASDIPLTREEFIRVHTACCKARLTEGIVPLLADNVSAGVGEYAKNRILFICFQFL